MDLEKKKAYHKEYHKEWYKRNKERVIEKMRSNEKVRRNHNSEIVNELKRNPCTDCGNCFETCCMDFDHVRGEKLAGISDLVKHGYNMEMVMEEIEKCELVCANCHRIRTRDRKKK